ncbi:MAG: nuclear transport factor 2 family protein [Gemmatimonadota bacterium]|nr:nuclear transport factor 2 family protein [Gemmatimonadota bacterium]
MTREAIDARRSEWIAAVESGDSARYAALLAPDATWVPPSGDAIVGRDAFRRWVDPFFERFDYAMDLDPETVRPAGEWAVETGRFVSRMTPREGGETAVHEGRYLVLWRHDPKGWRIDRYVDVTPA